LEKAGELWRKSHGFIWFSIGNWIMRWFFQRHEYYVLGVLGAHFIATRIAKASTVYCKYQNSELMSFSMIEADIELDIYEQTVISLEKIFGGRQSLFFRAINVEKSTRLIQKEVIRMTKELLEIS
jgi:hypothetical protein